MDDASVLVRRGWSMLVVTSLDPDENPAVEEFIAALTEAVRRKTDLIEKDDYSLE